MRKIKLGIYLILVFSLAMPVTPAVAAGPKAVHIEAYEEIGDPLFPGPWSASGPAVDAGLLCNGGTVIDTSVTTSGPSSGTTRRLRVNKHFTCGDGSGTFDIYLSVKLDLITSYTTANWKIVGGTGAYAGLSGRGKLQGTPVVPGLSINDVYNGKLH